MLNTVTVSPLRGDTTWGSSTDGSVISTSASASAAVSIFGSGSTTGAGFTTGVVGVSGCTSTAGVFGCTSVPLSNRVIYPMIPAANKHRANTM